MAAVTILLVLIGMAAIAAGWRTGGPLDPLERIFLFAAPVPAMLALVLPGVLVALTDFSSESRGQGLRFTEAGYLLSVALALAGIVLVVRRRTAGRSQDQRVVLGLFIAALPALLVGLVMLLYALG